MQGILIVDKPMDWTSFDVVAKLRGVLGTRKLGHSGTLDPMATGVLPVFCGGASKAVDLQLNHDKSYRAVLKLGARTDTGDVTGTVLETAPVTAGGGGARRGEGGRPNSLLYCKCHWLITMQNQCRAGKRMGNWHVSTAINTYRLHKWILL